MKRLLLVLFVVFALLVPNAGDATLAAPGVVGAGVFSSMAESLSVRVVGLFDSDDLSLTDLGARSAAIADGAREGGLDL